MKLLYTSEVYSILNTLYWIISVVSTLKFLPLYIFHVHDIFSRNVLVPSCRRCVHVDERCTGEDILKWRRWIWSNKTNCYWRFLPLHIPLDLSVSLWLRKISFGFVILGVAAWEVCYISVITGERTTKIIKKCGDMEEGWIIYRESRLDQHLIRLV